MKSRLIHIADGEQGERYREILGKVQRHDQPHRIVRDFWAEYQQSGDVAHSTSGFLIKHIVRECLEQFGSSPLFDLERDTFDLVSWTEQGLPITIACKAAMRERWKFADLEGDLLKLLFPGAESYLITLHKAEARQRQRYIDAGSTTGIDMVYLADEPEFDAFVQRMTESGLRRMERATP